jgi:hypothetical protein
MNPPTSHGVCEARRSSGDVGVVHSSIQRERWQSRSVHVRNDHELTTMSGSIGGRIVIACEYFDAQGIVPVGVDPEGQPNIGPCGEGPRDEYGPIEGTEHGYGTPRNGHGHNSTGSIGHYLRDDGVIGT